jgi:alpha-galactosidase
LPERGVPCERLAAYSRLCEASRVLVSKLEVRFRDAAEATHALSVPISVGEVSASGAEAGLSVAGRLKRPSHDEVIADVRVTNRSAEPVRLECVLFHVATRFPSSHKARFFKHGYQSWSASGPVSVSAQRHPRDNAPHLVRMCHQSEVIRPHDAPEAATSELFTVLESDASRERILAGFIGTSAQFTTLTLVTPAEIVARALLDSVVLAPGEERQIEPLLLARADESAARLAARWAARAGAAMKARTGAPYQRGWCSWYHYFHAISEDALRANLKALAAMRDEFPLEVVQLDDGFQAALGDWDRTNAKFPSGLKRIAEQIRASGFEAGIWTAPFLAARDSEIMTSHLDWFIHHESGEPMRAGYNTNWTTHQDAFAYAMDPSNPAFTEHLRRLFGKLVQDFGFSYLKLDFLYAGAAEGLRYDHKLTRAETLHRGLQAIRDGAGDDAFVLGCGCPLGPAVGVVDGMRIGPDVAPTWGSIAPEFGTPGTGLAIDAIIARSFMHRRLWSNDPDCLMLRESETQLDAEERDALAAVIAASGGMLLISDDMSLLGRKHGVLFREVAKIGAEVSAAAEEGPVLAPGMMASGPVRALATRLHEGWLAAVINLGDHAASVNLSSLGIAGRASVLALGDRERAGTHSIELAPHAARLIRYRD